MGEGMFVLLCLNSFLFSLIFWILTLAMKFFTFSKNKKRKLEFFECGFNSSIGVRVHVSLAYILILLFFILYDLEFLGFFIFSFFATTALISTWWAFLIFYTFLLLCFVIDYVFNLLEFVVR